MVCPWCYIGKRRLERALRLRPQPGLTRRWRAFQLNPGLPGSGMDRVSLLPETPASQHPPLFDDPEEFERRSRTIGALGPDVFRRQTALRCGFVGLGRLNGNLLFRLVEKPPPWNSSRPAWTEP